MNLVPMGTNGAWVCVCGCLNSFASRIVLCAVPSPHVYVRAVYTCMCSTWELGVLTWHYARHLIESSQKSRKVLYACFVDFHKAYDKVRRDYLIRRLAELGAHGRMLQAVTTQMYWSAPLILKLHGKLGEPTASTCGVKQGNPLSPLFGHFFAEFEAWLRERLPAAARVHIGQRLVQMLLYADDMVLLTHSACELQQC